ncbi:hypothetical protein C8F01DRAFT_1087946 [Mycena amicta]|nr:hypothetical protein C8F01DRAFT_1087946 [Mycena amicta]
MGGIFDRGTVSGQTRSGDGSNEGQNGGEGVSEDDAGFFWANGLDPNYNDLLSSYPDSKLVPKLPKKQSKSGGARCFTNGDWPSFFCKDPLGSASTSVSDNLFLGLSFRLFTEFIGCSASGTSGPDPRPRCEASVTTVSRPNVLRVHIASINPAYALYTLCQVIVAHPPSSGYAYDLSLGAHNASKKGLGLRGRQIQLQETLRHRIAVFELPSETAMAWAKVMVDEMVKVFEDDPEDEKATEVEPWNREIFGDTNGARTAAQVYNARSGFNYSSHYAILPDISDVGLYRRLNALGFAERIVDCRRWANEAEDSDSIRPEDSDILVRPRVGSRRIVKALGPVIRVLKLSAVWRSSGSSVDIFISTDWHVASEMNMRTRREYTNGGGCALARLLVMLVFWQQPDQILPGISLFLMASWKLCTVENGSPFESLPCVFLIKQWRRALRASQQGWRDNEKDTYIVATDRAGEHKGGGEDEDGETIGSFPPDATSTLYKTRNVGPNLHDIPMELQSLIAKCGPDVDMDTLAERPHETSSHLRAVLLNNVETWNSLASQHIPHLSTSSIYDEPLSAQQIAAIFRHITLGPQMRNLAPDFLALLDPDAQYPSYKRQPSSEAPSANEDQHSEEDGSSEEGLGDESSDSTLDSSSGGYGHPAQIWTMPNGRHALYLTSTTLSMIDLNKMEEIWHQGVDDGFIVVDNSLKNKPMHFVIGLRTGALELYTFEPSEQACQYQIQRQIHLQGHGDHFRMGRDRIQQHGKFLLFSSSVNLGSSNQYTVVYWGLAEDGTDSEVTTLCDGHVCFPEASILETECPQDFLLYLVGNQAIISSFANGHRVRIYPQDTLLRSGQLVVQLDNIQPIWDFKLEGHVNLKIMGCYWLEHPLDEQLCRLVNLDTSQQGFALLAVVNRSYSNPPGLKANMSGAAALYFRGKFWPLSPGGDAHWLPRDPRLDCNFDIDCEQGPGMYTDVHLGPYTGLLGLSGQSADFGQIAAFGADTVVGLKSFWACGKVEIGDYFILRYESVVFCERQVRPGTHQRRERRKTSDGQRSVNEKSEAQSEKVIRTTQLMDCDKTHALKPTESMSSERLVFVSWEDVNTCKERRRTWDESVSPTVRVLFLARVREWTRKRCQRTKWSLEVHLADDDVPQRSALEADISKSRARVETKRAPAETHGYNELSACASARLKPCVSAGTQLIEARRKSQFREIDRLADPNIRASTSRTRNTDIMRFTKLMGVGLARLAEVESASMMGAGLHRVPAFEHGSVKCIDSSATSNVHRYLPNRRLPFVSVAEDCRVPLATRGDPPFGLSHGAGLTAHLADSSEGCPLGECDATLAVGARKRVNGRRRYSVFNEMAELRLLTGVGEKICCRKGRCPTVLDGVLSCWSIESASVAGIVAKDDTRDLRRYGNPDCVKFGGGDLVGCLRGLGSAPGASARE